MLRVDTVNKFIVVGDDTTAGGANAALLIGDTCTNSKQCISLFEGLDINAVTGGDTDVLQMQGGAGIRFSTGYSITSRMVITNAGKVGIGTENPTEALTVQGNFNLTDGSTKGYRVRTSGGSIDMEASGSGVPGELWMSGWTGNNFTGTQVNWFRMSSGSRLIMVGTGSASATPIQIQLDHKSSASGTADPSGFSGAMYYNDSLDKFRCYEAGEWRNCVSGVTTVGTANASAAGTTVVATYANMPGTSSLAFTKQVASTNTVVTLNTSLFSTATATVVRLAIRVAGTDYDCAHMAINTANEHTSMSCTIVIPSIAAGSQTAQARWRRVSGAGTVTQDTNDWINLTVQETY
jgi:hypothetical protein